MGQWATCSGLDRITECPASSAMPQVRSSSRASKGGQDDHQAIEDALDSGADFVTTSGGTVQVSELLLPTEVKSEQAFSWDAVSGEAKNLGKLSASRGYPEAPYSTLFGTSDVAGVVSVEVGDQRVDAAFICDWKTGHPNFVPESDSWQMRALAFMSAKSSGLSYAITRVTSIREGFVTHKPQRLWFPEELDQTEVLLRKTYDAVNRAARKGLTLSDVKHGPHCTWCPAVASCPYMASILSGGRLSHLDTRDLAEAYRNWQALKTAETRMGDALKAAAGDDGIDLGGGMVFTRTKTGFRKIKRMAGE